MTRQTQVAAIIPFRSLRALVAVVTAFTVAHSMTLFASAYDWRPGRSGFRRSSRR